MVALEVEWSSVSGKACECARVDESEFDLVVASFAFLETEPNFDCCEGPSRFSPYFSVFSKSFASLLSISISEALISLLWTT